MTMAARPQHVISLAHEPPLDVPPSPVVPPLPLPPDPAPHSAEQLCCRQVKTGPSQEEHVPVRHGCSWDAHMLPRQLVHAGL
jgi:hypothetical protein